ncbi:hypothetical protein HPB50_028946 [Hyalomma asiaticum]|nr:hypothetical protein HPB50_028946 [Hyalomma asiaticum]
MWLEALGPVAEGARRVCSLHFGESSFRYDADTRRAMKRIRLMPNAVPQASASATEVERSVTGDEYLTGADDDNGLNFFEWDCSIGCNVEVDTDSDPCVDMPFTQLTARSKPQASVTSDHTYCRMRCVAVQTDRMQDARMRSKAVQVAPVKDFQSRGIQCDFQSWPAAELMDDLESSQELLNSSGHPLSDPIPPSPIRQNDCDPVPVGTQKQYIVSESCLMDLFKACTVCHRPCKVGATVSGSLLRVNSSCTCGHKSRWYSQPQISSRPLGSLLLCAAICFSGASPEKVIRLLKQANIPVPSTRMYYMYQSALFQPAIQRVWDTQQKALMRSLGGQTALAGDGRCDSPGFSAKYMTYSFMDTSTNKIVHFVQVQLGENSEVKSSNAMEKFGLKKGLEELKAHNVAIASLTTDRHVGIKKHMQTCEPSIAHKFDIWHVAKAIKKKLTVAAKKSACAALKDWIQPVINHLYWCVAVSEGDADLVVAMWKSMLNHVINVHTGHDSPYPRCLHGDVPNGKWLIPGTPAYARLVTIAMEKGLLKDMRQLSPSGQTYILGFMLKVLELLKCCCMLHRTQLAALHQNENAGRAQAVTKNGAQRWKRKVLRAKKGSEIVCPVKSNASYNYVSELITEMLQECSSCSSLRKAEHEWSSASSSHQPLAAIQLNQPRQSKSDLIIARQSRFSKNSDIGGT